MKVLKTILIIFGVLGVICMIGIYFFLKTVDTAKIKNTISENLKDTLDRQVKIDQLSFTFDIGKGLVLKAGGLSILDHPDFSKGDFLNIKEVDLVVDVQTFFRSRRIAVTSVEILEPRVQMIRLADGRINIPQPKNDIKVSVDLKEDWKIVNNIVEKLISVVDSRAFAQSTQESLADDFIKNLVVRLITIKQGQFSFLDKSLSMNLLFERVDLTIKDFNFNDYFPIDLKGSLLSDQQNIQLATQVAISSDFKKISFKESFLKSDLANINAQKVNSTFPSIAILGLEKMQGSVAINVSLIEILQNVLVKLNSQGKINDGKITLKYLAYPVENIDVTFEVNEKSINVSEIFMYLAKGKIMGRATVIDYLTKPTIAGVLNAEGLQLAELLEKFNLPVKIQGNLNAKIETNVDSIDPKELVSSLSGFGAITIKEGEIIDLNLLNLILSRVSVFPDLMEKLSQTLPDEYKQKLTKSNTTIDQFEATLELAQGKINIKDVSLGADGILVQASGMLDFDQNLELALKCSLKEDLSDSIVHAQEEFSYLMDSQKRINLPILPYKGKLSEIKIMPDLVGISKQAIESKGKDELKNLIFKALDLDDEPATNSTGNPTDGQNAQPQSPEKILINNVLDSIFK